MHPRPFKFPDVRPAILMLHLYGGLLCVPYLLVLGFSSLNFNHDFQFTKQGGATVQWQSSLPRVPVGSTAQETADRTRDALGMIGWAPYWELRPAPNGDLQFAVEHPGKSYKVELKANERTAIVEERHKGFWPVINSLHGLTEIPNSRLSHFWSFYTSFTTWAVLLICISGVYLWVSSRRERRIGFITCAAAVAISLVFMAWIVWRG